MVVELVDHTDPLLPAFPLCSGSKTYERLLDPALVKAAGFFFGHPRPAIQVRFTSDSQGSPHD